MFARSSHTLLLALPLLSCVAAGSIVRVPRSPAKTNNSIVQLFEWPWDSVASECTSFLGPLGMDSLKKLYNFSSVTGDQWWTDYQPVSYILTSKRGNREQFASMVSTCSDAGVGIIVDVVLNHMTAGKGTGFAGSSYSKYNYPAVPYTASQFHYCAGAVAADISDYNNITNVRFCELDSLSDLAQGQPEVQASIAGYLKDLMSLGVTGFRVDASKHMEPEDLATIFSTVGGSPYYTQEVPRGGASTPAQYTSNGDVIEFGATAYAMNSFLGNSGATVSNMVTPDPMGPSWDLLDSNKANYIMANQDTERGTTSLNSNSPNNAYTLSAIFMLGFNYGTPTVYSGYDFTNFDIGAPQDSAGNTNKVTCFSNGFRCEHRWTAIANMNLFHNAVGTAKLTNVFVGTPQQVAFGRGSVGFLVINNDANTWSETWKTSLPAGTYCDVIHDTDSDPKTCSGTTYDVSSDGTFTASVSAYDALALYSGSSFYFLGSQRL
ncbi:glycoside hydrolase family 13 protein [Mycena rosella]|uniref:Alpha-amylase n=1 Tax=Mycena rosella TaxID=1033263 RepID=A0AAD7DQ22_MYCRO|nr:glycoside hydrolase family 13 protein [Mycena rosella]